MEFTDDVFFDDVWKRTDLSPNHVAFYAGERRAIKTLLTVSGERLQGMLSSDYERCAT